MLLSRSDSDLAKGKFIWNGAKLLAAGSKAQEAGLRAVANRIVEKAKATVRVDSSNLQGSIKIQSFEATKNGFTVEVGSTEDYAAIQELGPADERKYGFTPYLQPAADQESLTLISDIKDAFNI